MISGDSVELTEKQVSSGDEVRAAAAPEGNSLPFVAPFNKVSPWVYLALTCLTVTFTSFMAVPLFAVVWPGFFLMYGCALDRLTWKFPAGGLLATFSSRWEARLISKTNVVLELATLLRLGLQ